VPSFLYFKLFLLNLILVSVILFYYLFSILLLYCLFHPKKKTYSKNSSFINEILYWHVPLKIHPNYSLFILGLSKKIYEVYLNQLKSFLHQTLKLLVKNKNSQHHLFILHLIIILLNHLNLSLHHLLDLIYYLLHYLPITLHHFYLKKLCNMNEILNNLFSHYHESNLLTSFPASQISTDSLNLLKLSHSLNRP
jgi:hypothetical protein